MGGLALGFWTERKGGRTSPAVRSKVLTARRPRGTSDNISDFLCGGKGEKGTERSDGKENSEQRLRRTWLFCNRGKRGLTTIAVTNGEKGRGFGRRRRFFVKKAHRLGTKKRQRCTTTGWQEGKEERPTEKRERSLSQDKGTLHCGKKGGRKQRSILTSPRPAWTGVSPASREGVPLKRGDAIS